MTKINSAMFYLVPGKLPGRDLCQRIAREIVPEDGTMFLFDGVRSGLELSDGSVQIIESPPFEVVPDRVLVGLVGRDKATVLARASFHIAGRDLAEHEVLFLTQAAVEGMRKSQAIMMDSDMDSTVRDMLDELITAHAGLPDLLDRFRALGDEGVLSLESLNSDARYKMAAGVVLRTLQKKTGRIQ